MYLMVWFSVIPSWSCLPPSWKSWKKFVNYCTIYIKIKHLTSNHALSTWKLPQCTLLFDKTAINISTYWAQFIAAQVDIFKDWVMNDGGSKHASHRFRHLIWTENWNNQKDKTWFSKFLKHSERWVCKKSTESLDSWAPQLNIYRNMRNATRSILQ